MRGPVVSLTYTRISDSKERWADDAAAEHKNILRIKRQEKELRRESPQYFFAIIYKEENSWDARLHLDMNVKIQKCQKNPPRGIYCIFLDRQVSFGFYPLLFFQHVFFSDFWETKTRFFPEKAGLYFFVFVSGVSFIGCKKKRKKSDANC